MRNKAELPLEMIGWYLLIIISIFIASILMYEILKPADKDFVKRKIHPILDTGGKDVCKKYNPGEVIDEYDFKRILLHRFLGYCNESSTNYVILDFTISREWFENVLIQLGIETNDRPLLLYRNSCDLPRTFKGVGVEGNEKDKVLFQRHSKITIKNTGSGVIICNYMRKCGDGICDPDEKSSCMEDCGILNECEDGIDNDGDGKIDMDDKGCDNRSDNDESNCGDGICEDGENVTNCIPDCRNILMECEDGIDNDRDNLTDRDDPGCWTDENDPSSYNPKDNDESNCGDNVCENFERNTCIKDCKTAGKCSLKDVIQKIDPDNMMVNLREIAKPKDRSWGSPWNLQTAEFIKEKLKEYGLKNVDFDDYTYGGRKVRNVRGIIGTGNNAIIVGAHRDGVGSGGGSCKGGSECPAAVDNGGGIVSVMEVGKSLASCKNLNNKVITLFFDAEEAGLIGSRLYVRNKPLNNVLGMINNDCVGWKGGSGLTIYSSSRKLSESADKCCQLLNITCYRRFGDPDRSDHTSFRSRGVETMFVKDSDTLCGPKYHSVGDTIDLASKIQLGRHAKLISCIVADLSLNN